MMEMVMLGVPEDVLMKLDLYVQQHTKATT